jgi:glucan 1,3-beta-glucosidase
LCCSYLQAYDVVRKASGTGTGNGPFIGYHDAFFSDSEWSGFMPNADRIALDTHPYICFGGQSDAAISTYAKTPCSQWGSNINNSMSNFGLTIAGEFSNAVTDCGLWLNGVGLGTRYDGTYTGGGDWPSQGSCTPWTDWQNYNSAMKKGLMNFALASMDALQVS